MIVILDAANTIIHKPSIFTSIQRTLADYGHKIDLYSLEERHKLVSEFTVFPDRTDYDFYMHFNGELLYSLGIIPTKQMLDDIFSRCSYAPWKAFSDVDVLGRYKGRLYILSNFHSRLNEVLEGLLPTLFSGVIASEDAMLRKPDLEFYRYAMRKLSVSPSEVVYIGDSIKLDLEPALAVGINAWLIDRNNLYPFCDRRITSLREIEKILL